MMTNREPAGALPEVITNPVEAGGLATLGSGNTCDTRAHTGSISLPGMMLPGNGEQTAFRQLDKFHTGLNSALLKSPALACGVGTTMVAW